MTLKLCTILLLGLLTCSSGVKIKILHFNDIESQLLPFKEGSDPPNINPPVDIGGLARIINELEFHEKEDELETFRVATANLVGGQNGWLSMLGWDKFGELMEFYKPDVMGLGLREFESDLPRLRDYLKFGAPKPLVSNFDLTSCMGNLEHQFCTNYTAHYQIESFGEGEGIQIGFVGFVNPIAERLSDPGNLKFVDIPATAAAFDKILESNDFSRVRTAIAIGSGSLAIAKQIIDNVKSPKLKLVIFGGIATNMTGNFPFAYKGAHIATALDYGQAIGKIVMDFDANGVGKVIPAESDLFPTTRTTGENTSVVIRVEELEGEIKAKNTKLGKTLVPLEGTKKSCWRSECNLGNLVADAMVHCAINKFNDIDKYKYMVGVVGIWHSGAIFDDTVTANHDIYALDVHKWLPYHNNAYLVTTSGATLKMMFQYSGKAINAPTTKEKDWGQFLQVSNGMEVKYNTKGELTSLRTLHLNGSVPILEDVQDTGVYNFVIPSILYKGKSVYDFLPDKFLPGGGGGDFTYIDFDDNCLSNYISGVKVLKLGFEERIFIEDNPNPTPGGGGDDCKGSNTAVTVILTLVISAIIVGIVIVGWKFVWPRFRQRGHTSSYP
jgi:5'-nucleotidase